MRAWSPTRIIVPRPSRCARTAPATISSGALSPPIASSAMRGNCGLPFKGDHVFTGPLSAVVILDVYAVEVLGELRCYLARIAFLLRPAVIEREQAAFRRAHFACRRLNRLRNGRRREHSPAEARGRCAALEREPAELRILAGEKHISDENPSGAGEQILADRRTLAGVREFEDDG